MEKLEVLCTTMHQTDFSKIKEMNIQSDVVFANQADRYSYEELGFNGHTARMVSTAQRGVGKNRNIALLYATAEICIFADDDVRYVDGYRDKVIAAFKEVPDADVIIFNLTSQLQRKPRQNKKIKKCKIWNVLGYGTCRIAFKLSSVHKANIWFTQLFGGGCKYPSGEDSMLLLEALRKGLKMYTHPLVIGEVKQEDSTWFKGYNEEYFFCRGAWTQAALPRIKYVIFLCYIVRLRNLATIPIKQMIQMMFAGANSFKHGESYNDLEQSAT